ncbi:MAG: FtsQ-type POTRA domain-containing protein, partial [Clostridia bacterium]|nr:FtsQ-type POTRA domain-containing protein [Clostridia bacterium]
MSQQLPPDFSPFGPMRDEIPASAVPPTRKRTGVWTLVLTLVVILAAAVLVNESLLQIRNIGVVGNSKITWDEIVTDAGLKKRTSFFTLNEKKIAAGINQNRYLVYEKMEKHFPDSIVLYVKERLPRANVQVMGVT